MEKLYAYVDETGQDTQGKFFLVSVVITGEEREELRTLLRDIEAQSGKGKKKWVKATLKQKQGYVERLFKVRQLQGKIFYAEFHQTAAYTHLTLTTIAKAVHQRAKGIRETYRTTIFVDGLSRREEQQFGTALRRMRIRVEKVRGLRDESDELIRVADAMAGWVRDALEGKPYAAELYREVTSKGIVQEL